MFGLPGGVTTACGSDTSDPAVCDAGAWKQYLQTEFVFPFLRAPSSSFN